MAEAPAAAAYTAGQESNEQQFVQQQYSSYQSQVTSQGGQQNTQESFEQQVTTSQGGEQQVAGASYSDQANAGLIQQYTGATGQLAQQQGQGGYKINFDPNPQIIRKQAGDAVTYKQEVAVRYLRPPTPPPPGPLIIKEVSCSRYVDVETIALFFRFVTQPCPLHHPLSSDNDHRVRPRHHP